MFCAGGGGCSFWLYFHLLLLLLWCVVLSDVVSIVVTVFNTITTFIITVIIITALVSLSTAILSGSEKLESELLKFSDSLGSDSEESGIVLATVGGPLELVLDRKPLLCFLIITSHLTITLDLVSMSLFSVITTLGWTDLTVLTTGVTLAALLPNSLSHIFSGILTDLRALTILLSLLVYWNWFDVAITANSLL